MKILWVLLGFLTLACSKEEGETVVDNDESITETVELGNDNVIRPNRRFIDRVQIPGFLVTASTRTTQGSIRRGFIDVDITLTPTSRSPYFIDRTQSIQFEVNAARYGYFSGFVQRNTTVRRVGNFSNGERTLRRFYRVPVPRGSNIDGARNLAFNVDYNFVVEDSRNAFACRFCCPLQSQDRPNCIRNCGGDSRVCDRNVKRRRLRGTIGGMVLGQGGPRRNIPL